MKNQHYYTERHTLEDKFKKFDFLFENKSFKFTTNSGVFSRDYIDFGSLTLLKVLHQLNPSGKHLEVGCGYGAITLPLAFFHPENHYDMIDINEEAIRLCDLNSRENKIVNIRVFKSDIYEAVEDQDYDLIYSNPPIRAGKKVTYKIYEDSRLHLRSGGQFLIVIQKKQGEKSSLQKLIEIYGNCDILAKNKGYFVLRSKKE